VVSLKIKFTIDFQNTPLLRRRNYERREVSEVPFGTEVVRPVSPCALNEFPAALSTNIKPLPAMKRIQTEKLRLVVTKDEVIREVSRTCGPDRLGPTGWWRGSLATY
jgi:hypothetical protein